MYVCVYIYGRDSVVGIAPRYRLDGPWFEPRWGLDFPHHCRPVLRPTQPPIQWVPRPFSGAKTARAWRWPPTTNGAEAVETVELYLYSLHFRVPSQHVTGWTIHTYIIHTYIHIYIYIYIYIYIHTHTYIQPVCLYHALQSIAKFNWPATFSKQTINHPSPETNDTLAVKRLIWKSAAYEYEEVGLTNMLPTTQCYIARGHICNEKMSFSLSLAKLK